MAGKRKKKKSCILNNFVAKDMEIPEDFYFVIHYNLSKGRIYYFRKKIKYKKCDTKKGREEKKIRLIFTTF